MIYNKIKAFRLNNLIYKIIIDLDNIKTIILRKMMRLKILIKKVLLIPKTKFVDLIIILSSFIKKLFIRLLINQTIYKLSNSILVNQ